MTVAVIMPLFNKDTYVTQAIASVMAQTIKDWQLYIIDDGSTDNSLMMAQHIGGVDTKINIAKHDSNQGVARAVNTGLEKAIADKADSIIKLDPDDFLFPYALEILNRELKKGNDVVCAGHLVHREDEGTIERSIMSVPDISIHDLVYGMNRISGGSVLMAREVCENVGYWDENLQGGWDLDYWIRIIAHGYTFAKVELPVYIHRQYQQQMYQESIDSGRWHRWREQIKDKRRVYRNIIKRREEI